MPYRAPADVEPEPLAPEPELPDVEPGPVALRAEAHPEPSARDKAWAALLAGVVVVLAAMGAWVLSRS